MVRDRQRQPIDQGFGGGIHLRSFPAGAECGEYAFAGHDASSIRRPLGMRTLAAVLSVLPRQSRVASRSLGNAMLAA